MFDFTVGGLSFLLVGAILLTGYNVAFKQGKEVGIMQAYQECLVFLEIQPQKKTQGVTNKGTKI